MALPTDPRPITFLTIVQYRQKRSSLALPHIAFSVALILALSLSPAWAGGTDDDTRNLDGTNEQLCQPTDAADVCQSKMSQDAVNNDAILTLSQRLPQQLRLLSLNNPGSHGGRVTVLSNSLQHSIFLQDSAQHLIEFDPLSKSFVANIAHDFGVVDDMTISVTLRDGHRWSDGEHFTVDDVTFSIQSQHSYENLEFTMQDRHTIHISCSTCRHDELLISLSRLVLYPEHAKDKLVDESIAGYQDLYTSNLPTLRPWVLLSQNGHVYRFQRNHYFHTIDSSGNQLPYLDEVYVKIFTELGVDDLSVHILQDHALVHANVPLSAYKQMMEEVYKSDLHTVEERYQGLGNFLSFVFHYAHNDDTLRRLFLSKEFRAAMSLAIDRTELAADLFELVEPWSLPVSQDWTNVGHVPEPKFDIDRARRMLLSVDDVSFDSEGNLLYLQTPVILRILIFNWSHEIEMMAHDLASMWAALGVDVKLTFENSSDRFCNEAKSGVYHAIGVSLNFSEFSRPIMYPHYITPPFHSRSCPLTSQDWTQIWESKAFRNLPAGFPRSLFEAAERWTQAKRWRTSDGSLDLTDDYRSASRDLLDESARWSYTIGTVTWPLRLLIRSNYLQTNGDTSSAAWDASR